MVVRFEKCELKIDQIHKEEFPKESFVSHEIKVLDLIKKWINNEALFVFKTSGSTGKAKTISIERERIKYSCETTMDRIDPDHQFENTLLCINPEMIGGAMVVFRALVWDMNLHVIKPSSNPFELIGPNSAFDLVSMVPMQLHYAQTNQLNCFHTILVGGVHYSGRLQETTANIYSTFGMTETVSHFALKETNSEVFECLGDIQLQERADKRLAIQGTLTDHKSLITNDLIDFISTKKFRWIGRSDFVINSGGIKISPEEVEMKLSGLIDRRFIISFLEDKVLGSKVILIIEGDYIAFESKFQDLKKYEQPKEIHFLDQFVLTPSQKINRTKTRELLLKLLSVRS